MTRPTPTTEAGEDTYGCPECGLYWCICFRDEDHAEDGYDPGAECGRWINGRLGPSCSLAGTEWCDWDCPYSR